MQLEDLPAGTVVVGVDGSASSGHALTWAIDQAGAERRGLVVVHAVGPVGAVWTDQDGTDSRTGLPDTTPLLADGQQMVDDACDEARRRLPGLDVHGVLRVADPRDVLLALARRAEVLVVGSRGRGPVRRLLLGSVSVSVVRHATCPVVVVRPGDSHGGRQGVLVGIDGSERSSEPLRFAFRHASQRRLPLTVLHTYPLTRSWGDLSPEAEEEERVLLAGVLSGVQEDYPDVAVRVELVPGLPSEDLLRRSASMDLVVVGSPTGGAPWDLLFGSIASFLAEHATCAVAVVPVAARG